MIELDMQYWKSRAQDAESKLHHKCVYRPVKDKSILNADTLLESDCGHMFVPQADMNYCPFCQGQIVIERAVREEPEPEVA